MDPDPLERRVRAVNPAVERPRGEYVLYWMIASRRPGWSFALEHAAAAARRLGRPLLVLEPLRVAYPWASDRLHAFVLHGMAANARAFAERGVSYHPYVEPEAGAGSGLLEALSAHACLVVTDDFPTFFLPRMVAAAAHKLDVRLDAVDGAGLMPVAEAEIVYPTAYAFRRFLQKHLPDHLLGLPVAEPLAGLAALGAAELPKGVARRWPRASAALLAAEPAALAKLPIDHSVAPVAGGFGQGGFEAARARLARFVRHGLASYAEGRRDPDTDGSSGLSAWLHFGHLSAHEVFAAIARHEAWNPSRLHGYAAARGKKEGFWGMRPDAEAYLDELITWRELGFNFCARRDDHDRYESLPAWAQRTLDEHANDPRPERYTHAELEAAATADPIWNAAQTQLVQEGRIHNYLRMLWGKKILEWSPSPRAALASMIELNNRYALDGRDPNSCSGIFWCLGRYDRPWAPVRKIFGTIRYMSSASTRKKLALDAYLERWGGGAMREERAARKQRPART